MKWHAPCRGSGCSERVCPRKAAFRRAFCLRLLDPDLIPATWRAIETSELVVWRKASFDASAVRKQPLQEGPLGEGLLCKMKLTLQQPKQRMHRLEIVCNGARTPPDGFQSSLSQWIAPHALEQLSAAVNPVLGRSNYLSASSWRPCVYHGFRYGRKSLLAPTLLPCAGRSSGSR